MDFVVNKTNPSHHTWISSSLSSTNNNPPSPLQHNEAILQVEMFAITANVVGYAVAGEALKYFDFFPIRSHNNTSSRSMDQNDLFGRVPTWGICRVIQSNNKDLKLGMRFYGMVPITNHPQAFTVKPSPLQNGSFIDLAPHRKNRDVVYNTYVVAQSNTDLLYPGIQYEIPMILLRPLFLTAWLLKETVIGLNCNELVITSSSSKTGMALAWCVSKYNLQHHPSKKITIIGLTSKSNVSYLQSLNLYHQIIIYDDIKTKPLPSSTKSNNNNTTCIVDLAGNVAILRQIQSLYEPKAILVVGATHLEASDLSISLTGEGFRSDLPKPSFFFAPKVAGKMIKELGNVPFQQRVSQDFITFVKESQLEVHVADSPTSISEVYEGFVRGTIPAKESWIGKINYEVSSVSSNNNKL
jgi:hypothetical protein